MAYINATVYDPPSGNFPFIAVVFDTKGEVLVARAVPSRAAGEALLESVMKDFAAYVNSQT